MAKSSIEWTNETWNIITGCSKHSEGCLNCYAEKMHKRLTAMGQAKYSKPFNEVVFHPEAVSNHNNFSRLDSKRKLIFVNSMSDTFHDSVTDVQIMQILDECEWNDPNVFQILTKRAERLADFKYPFNVWLGVTVEMAKYKSRMEYLKQTNAKIKFLSCEPLLEDLGELDLRGIDWVICGGESGRNARPCNPEWVKNIQRQCQEQGVPFFFKQWGEWLPAKYNPYSKNRYTAMLKDEAKEKYKLACYHFNFLKKKYKIHIWPGETLSGKPINISVRVGKNKAGSMIGLKEYKEFPAIPELKEI